MSLIQSALDHASTIFEKTSDTYPAVDLTDGHLTLYSLHTYLLDGSWRVALNPVDEDFSGLLLTFSESRQTAIADALVLLHDAINKLTQLAAEPQLDAPTDHGRLSLSRAR